jgi:hypothetical protein
MLPTPLLNTAHLLGTSEMISVAVLAPPTLLAGALAGLPTIGLRTIPLPIRGPRIRNEERVATTALASASMRAAHRAPNTDAGRPSWKSKRNGKKNHGRRRKKSFVLKSGKKTQPKKTEFQTAISNPLSSRR